MTYADNCIIAVEHNIEWLEVSMCRGATPEQVCGFINEGFKEDDGEHKLNEIYTLAKAKIILKSKLVDDSGGQLMRKNPLNRLFSIFRKQKP